MISESIKKYLSPRVYPLLVLGIASGLPLALTGGTFQAWATVAGVSLKQIGFLTLVGTAYTFKFLWAPLIDRYAPLFLGRRRSWMVVSQVALGTVMLLMGLLNPAQDLIWLALLATTLAFLSATQDIAFDAYSTEVLDKDERAHGVAVRTLGYRIGMIISGGLGIVLAERWLGWGGMYMAMGCLMFVFAICSAIAPETREVQAPRTLQEAFIVPFKEFFSRPEALAILMLIVLYKLGDAFAGALSTTFLIRGAGFAAETVGWVNKILAVIATIIGALVGGALMNKLGLYRSLMLFGVLQAVSNLAYWLVAITPHNLPIMALAVGLENISGGMGTTAFVALVMGLCNSKYTATQFALLTALSSVGRVFLAGPLTPPLVESLGWPAFFLCTVLIALPGLFLLRWHKARIMAIE
ncbi:muropeptide transporter [Pelistega indica]|uniref:Muropeptide transporter n=1 Tax=Pelistega indica TaxID=1414851 RepID=V8FYT0_9BURK|nr:MFS transporter [Pelistega indica]ETD68587.1 muropeptide transporter [Pelistega indica]